MGRRIEYTRPDGGRVPAYYAAPEKEPSTSKAVVVIAEWWGLTSDVMGIADRYAENGFRALVPDLFRGRTAATGDEANHLMEGLDFQDAYSQDVAGALHYLKADSEKVGVTGYCMGGALTLLTAMHSVEADAAVCFYGIPPVQAGDPGTIEIPLLCHFGKHDEFFPPSRVDELEDRLRSGRVPYRLYWYDAGHGFCNPNQPGNAGLGNYNPTAAHEAWERTIAFFKESLSSG